MASDFHVRVVDDQGLVGRYIDDYVVVAAATPALIVCRHDIAVQQRSSGNFLSVLSNAQPFVRRR